MQKIHVLATPGALEYFLLKWKMNGFELLMWQWKFSFWPVERFYFIFLTPNFIPSSREDYFRPYNDLTKKPYFLGQVPWTLHLRNHNLFFQISMKKSCVNTEFSSSQSFFQLLVTSKVLLRCALLLEIRLSI